MLSAVQAQGGRRFLDRLLLVLLVVVVFLLGCYEMGDSDIWWHLRGGQWILEHGRVPHLDPFTFGSADKAWIDIHWSYEVILTLAYRRGGAGALVVMGASLGAGALLAVLTARRRDWPITAIVLCWMPAVILLSFRLDPRPEIFSLLYLGCYLAVLWRVEEGPLYVWLLPLLQVLWVNVQGLFILGPILLGMFIAAHGARLLWQRLHGSLTWTAEEQRWCRHVGGAAVTVALACLANPYFLDGARFPFDLFPKVADPNNPYKKYIDELQSPSDFVSRSTLPVAGANWFFLALYFLLPLLALSFLYPTVWRAWQTPRPSLKEARPTTEVRGAPAIGAWLGGLAVIVALLLLGALTLAGKGPTWLQALGDNIPLALLLGTFAGVLLSRKRCPPASAVAGTAGVALAVYVAWLDATLLGGGRGLLAGSTTPEQMTPLLAIAGAVASTLVLFWRGDLFRLLLAGAFAYLALQAMQNWSRFALVAGAVLSWNFAEWAGEWAAAKPLSKRWIAANWFLGLALVVGLGLWMTALVGDRYYVHTGEPRHFAFREEPLAFAHDAASFAGRPGLPDRALVYGLAQTGVYVFHNAPRCKPYMDGRLEMPDLQTFKTYTNIEQWLRDHDPRWEKAVADMGYPLLLFEHQSNHDAEALLLTHPDWRCVYFDALAAVFVARERGVSTEDFPTVDFAAHHFHQPQAASTPNVTGAAGREEKALFNLAASSPRSPHDTWRWRIPILLAALDRARIALDENPKRADVWVLLGNCYWNLNPDLSVRPFTPADDWSLEQSIWLAQATYCFRKALHSQPDHPAAYRSLFQVYGVRGMVDSQSAAGERWLLADPKLTAKQREQIGKAQETMKRLKMRGGASADRASPLDARLPEAAIQLIEARKPLHGSWVFAEQTARLYMHLGRPADARRMWEQASDCPSPALRQCRLASTFWVERDFDAAIRLYDEARKADPQLAEPYWGLAMLHTQLGKADPAWEACRNGLQLTLNARQRSDLVALQQFLRPYCSGL